MGVLVRGGTLDTQRDTRNAVHSDLHQATWLVSGQAETWSEDNVSIKSSNKLMEKKWGQLQLQLNNNKTNLNKISKNQVTS